VAMAVSLGALAVWAILATIEVTLRDGLRPVPYDPAHPRR